MVEVISRAEGRGSKLLWFGILAAPTAWAVQLLIAPDLSEVLCYPGAAGSGLGEVFGVGIESFLVGLTAILTLIAALGGVASYSCWRKLQGREDSTPARRATWMARAGILVSALFLGAIVMGFLPMAFLGSCGPPA